MEDRVKNYLKIPLYFTLVLFVVMNIVRKPPTLKDVFGCATTSITIAIVIMTVYEKWFWRFNPFTKTPKLQKQYDGKIEYLFEGTQREKSIMIHVNQTLLDTRIKIVTDEITSNLIASRIVYENQEYVLYYTYITNPKNKCSEKNPIQYGTCRIMLDNMAELQGTYWTSRKTIGDIYLRSNCCFQHNINGGFDKAQSQE